MDLTEVDPIPVPQPEQGQAQVENQEGPRREQLPDHGAQGIPLKLPNHARSLDEPRGRTLAFLLNASSLPRNERSLQLPLWPGL